MRFALRLVMLWTAGLLLMAHSVVPHAHHEKQLFGSLQGVSISAPRAHQPSPLEVDLGSDHLEHFRLDDANSLQLGVGADSPVLFQAYPSTTWVVPESMEGTPGLFPPALELPLQFAAVWGGIRPPPVRL